MRMRLIVTGAAGRIGQAFIKAHQDRYEFTGFDRKPTPNVARSVTANLTDFEALAEAARGCAAMIHLGAHPNQHHDYPGVIVASNVVGTYHALEAAARAGVRRVVFASTVQTEFGWGEGVKVSVTMPARPTNFYSSSKVWGEHLGFLYARDRGLSVICLRLGGVLPAEQEEALIESGEAPDDIALFSRDAVEILKRAVEIEGVPFAVLPAYSRNAEAIKDLEPLRRVLGFSPERDARLGAPRADDPAGDKPEGKQVKELLAAVGRGDLPAVEAALAADPRLAEAAGRGPGWEDRNVRPLHVAARQGRTEVIRLLLDRGVDVRAAGGRHRWTAVQFAAASNQPAAAEQLLARGAERDVFVEAGLGEVDRLRARLTADPAQVRAATATGVTPLHVAGTAEAVRLLLDRGADPEARDDWRRAPLTWAFGKPEVARALAERIGALNIFLAAAVGDAALATTLLAADPAAANAETPADGQFWPGRRALHLAVIRGHLEVIRVLLARGADINALDPEGATALHMAAWHGQNEVIRLLVDSGARLFAGDAEWSATPREWAEHAGNPETVKLLAELEAAHPAPAAREAAGPLRRILLTGSDSPAGRAFRSNAASYEIIPCDSFAPDDLARAMTGCDAVVHCSGAPRESEFSAFLDQDILRLWHLLQAARLAGVRRFVYASTPDVFAGWRDGGAAAWPGDPQGQPGPGGVDPEKTPLRPGSLWAAVKALNEHMCIAYGKRLKTPAVSVRLTGDEDGRLLLEALEQRTEIREGNKGQQ